MYKKNSLFESVTKIKEVTFKKYGYTSNLDAAIVKGEANWIMNFCGLSNPKLPATNIFTTQSFFKGFQYETCVICLDDYEEGDQLQVMPCCHAYHSECIKLWLMQKQVVCPICKRQVVKSFEDVHFEGLFDIEPN
ncbi:Zinc finger, RING-type,Zinc finger, RING/FYVE/PHD-type [Cinara cedri]|uniref:Zinc finger, RING-type,Zinc finger, RING/FYVE/PHD-type n=1 Tax=Cinara cedri TaxID=506608 RepID=A0A5E4NMT7_9HEMI|nr:Zinc finger, RING-type,Zinc finger, RING/FYVE/PHD-type [Cinara cedri]